MNFEAIKQTIKDEIANPERCYMPNSPASFVKHKLIEKGFKEEAKLFWDKIVWDSKFGILEIDALIPTLNGLNANERMPEWGTRGT